MNVKKLVADDLAHRRQILSEALAETEKAEKLACADLHYLVRIGSCWSDYGEKAVEVTAATLPEAMKNAQSEFMTTNSRSDVQGNYFVYACTGGLQVALPEKFWKKYKNK